jgi:hypothetical protein
MYRCGQLDLVGSQFVLGAKPAEEMGEERPMVSDDFTDSRPEGAVIGTASTSGHKRLGVDVEGVLSIDNGALRIAPLIDAGFNRAGLAYGPFVTQPGLAFAVYMLNGHNTAQAEPLPDSFRKRMDFWFNGSGSDSRKERLVRWFLSGRVRRALRQFRRWKHTAKGRPVALLDENLAVGWFPSSSPPDPRKEGHPFIMHALGPENGYLWAGAASHRTRSLRGVQNVPLYYVAVIRAESIIYYVSSVDGVVGLPPHPWLRPIAVDTQPCPDELYLGIHQSVLGQIGWRIDSRVRGIRVAQIPGYQAWHGGAHAADRLEYPPQDGKPAELGGKWKMEVEGRQCGLVKAASGSAITISVLDPAGRSDLIHAVVSPRESNHTKVGVVWRFVDLLNHWRLEFSSGTGRIIHVREGQHQILAAREYANCNADQRRLQVLDDGNCLMAYFNGEPVSDSWITSEHLSEATKVGILFDTSGNTSCPIRSFEAHPRQVKLPAMLDMGSLWLRKGTEKVIVDDFSGEHGNLAGRVTPVGGIHWHRVIGEGLIELTGMGAARVRASVEKRCPGRTAYCVDWSYPDYADLEVTITPPGNQRSKKDQTTAGFILYQDAENYVTVNAYRADYYPGGSVSSFFKFGGFEDIYDAVWSNVAERIGFGKPARLRLCCDGEQYSVFINDETVLYRAFRDVYPNVAPLKIHKVGLIANWEFGTDTGSMFKHFNARV